jgi:hypothetical protein
MSVVPATNCESVDIDVKGWYSPLPLRLEGGYVSALYIRGHSKRHTSDHRSLIETIRLEIAYKNGIEVVESPDSYHVVSGDCTDFCLSPKNFDSLVRPNAMRSEWEIEDRWQTAHVIVNLRVVVFTCSTTSSLVDSVLISIEYPLSATLKMVILLASLIEAAFLMDNVDLMPVVTVSSHSSESDWLFRLLSYSTATEVSSTLRGTLPTRYASPSMAL